MRARGLLVSVLSCIVMVWAAAAGAQSYPSHTVTLISPYAAGSGIDVLARLIASGLGPRLGQTIVVDAKPGAGSAIGTGFVAKAAPDGYTLMLTSSVLPVLPALYKVLPFDPTADFTHIIKLATGSMALVVNPTALPVKSLDELVKIVRAQPVKLNYADDGNGTPGSGNAVLPAYIITEDLIEYHWLSDPNPRVFQLGTPGSLASQHVVVKFGAPVVKGANYAHYQVLVDR